MVTGIKNQSVSNMEKKTLDILADAISDVGSLQWWYADDKMVQVEFRDIQLYDESKPEKDTHTIEAIAIRFIGNVFAVFLDNLSEEEGKPWYERLYDDEIPPFECNAYDLEFDHPEYAQEVYDEYRNQTPITTYDGMNTLTGANHLIAAKCGDVGVIAGGDRMEVVTHNGLLSEEEIVTLSKKWWEYWKDYWRLRKTQNAYQKDWACEVTIPVNPNNP